MSFPEQFICFIQWHVVEIVLYRDLHCHCEPSSAPSPADGLRHVGWKTSRRIQHSTPAPFFWLRDRS